VIHPIFLQFVEKLRKSLPKEIFSRGKTIYNKGGVTLEKVNKDASKFIYSVPGNVESSYKVSIFLDYFEVEAECTCIYYEENDFCKHVVAAALAMQDSPSEQEKKINKSNTKKRKSSEPHEIDLPESLRNFGFLQSYLNLYDHFDRIESISLDNTRLNFVIENTFANYSYTTQVYNDKEKLLIQCSCDTINKLCCQHESLALAYIYMSIAM
jgi:hypothetical protein